MAGRDYSDLINLAAELGQYDGYLDTAGITERNNAQAAYQKALRVFVYHLLKEANSASEAKQLVEADFPRNAGHSSQHWRPVYDEVRADLLAQIERDGGKKAWQRALRYYAPAIVGVILAAIYFGLRLYSALPVDKPLDSREGMIERAAVIEKMGRYDDWVAGGSGRYSLVRDVLFWPIEPNDKELRAGNELIALIGGRYAILAQAKQACVLILPPGTGLPGGDQRVEMLRKVAAYLRGPGVAWQQPIANTIDAPIKAAYPCHEIDYEQIQKLIQSEQGNRTQPALPPSD